MKWVVFLFMRKVVGIKIVVYRLVEGKVWRLLGYREGCGLFMLLKKSLYLMIIGGKFVKYCEFIKINIFVDWCGVLLENGFVCNVLF